MPEQQAGLLTAFEHEGVWWTPNNASNRVSGTLSYDPGNGARLDLLGHLTPEQTFFSANGSGSPTTIIHGLTKDGKFVTLDGVYTLHYQIRLHGQTTESFRSKRVLIGKHLEAPESSMFCSCQFRFTNMEEWLSTEAFNFTLKNATQPYEFTLSCRTQPVSTYRVDPIGASLKTAGSFQTHDITPRHYGVTVQSWFVLTPDERRPLSWYTDIITRMRNLAALCLGQPAYIEEMGVFKCDSSGTQRPRIDVYYVQNPSPQARRAIDIQEPLLTLPSFGDQIETVLDRWFTVCETVSPALNLFLAVFFGVVRHIDVKFVLLAQAVEAFHRLMHDSIYIQEKDYAKAIKPIQKAIPRGLPKKLKNKLFGMLKYGNEFSFYDRLEEIVSRTKTLSTGRVIEIDNAVLRSVVDTRNYHTHYSEKLRAKAAKGADLVFLNETLASMCMCIIFEALGLREEQVEGALRRGSHLFPVTRMRTSLE